MSDSALGISAVPALFILPGIFTRLSINIFKKSQRFWPFAVKLVNINNSFSGGGGETTFYVLSVEDQKGRGIYCYLGGCQR